MKQFQYQAIDLNGQRTQGIVEAKDASYAAKVLKDRNLIITYLDDPKQGVIYYINSKLSHITSRDVIAFTRQLAAMLNAGLPITKSLDLIKKQVKPAMEKIIDSIQSSVEGGQSLYDALLVYDEIFSPLYLSLVRAGELAGVLGTVLDQLSNNMQRSEDFKAKVKSAMLYPAIVLVAMFIVSLIMVFFVMPQMAQLYSEFEADLPLTTSLMINGSEFIRIHWYLLILLIAALGATIIYFIKSDNGKTYFDTNILKLPIIGQLQHKIISTNVIRTLALLNNAGVSIVESLEIVSKAAGNQVYEKGIIEVSKKVEKGVSLGVSFGVLDLFPEMIIQMMTVGEETGKLAEMLEKAAVQFEKETLMSLKSLTSAIEPTLIIVLGIVVGFMVISIIMPIYGLTQSF